MAWVKRRSQLSVKSATIPIFLLIVPIYCFLLHAFADLIADPTFFSSFSSFFFFSSFFLIFFVSFDLTVLVVRVFQYQARLRLPDTFSHSQKMQCVDHIIEVLDLAACQDTSEYRSDTIDGSCQAPAVVLYVAACFCAPQCLTLLHFSSFTFIRSFYLFIWSFEKTYDIGLDCTRNDYIEFSCWTIVLRLGIVKRSR